MVIAAKRPRCHSMTCSSLVFLHCCFRAADTTFSKVTVAAVLVATAASTPEHLEADEVGFSSSQALRRPLMRRYARTSKRSKLQLSGESFQGSQGRETTASSNSGISSPHSVPAKRTHDEPDEQRFSSYRCLGLPYWSREHYPIASAARPRPHCRFTDVCSICDGIGKCEFVFHRPPDRRTAPLMFAHNGEPLDAFPKCFTSAEMTLAPANGSFCFQPRIEYSPSKGCYHPARVAVMISPGLHDNLGHLWFQWLSGYQALLDMFGLAGLPQETQMLWSPAVSGMHEVVEQAKDRFGKAALDAHDSWLGLLSSSPPKTLPEGATCYRNLLVGEANLDIFMASSASTYVKPTGSLAFPSLAATYLGQNGPRFLSKLPLPPQITLQVKEGRRAPTNYGEIRRALRQAFPLADLSELDFVHNEHKPTVQTQLQILQRTHLLITPAGGMAAAALFMPIGASALLFAIWGESTWWTPEGTLMHTQQQENGTYDYETMHWKGYSHIVVKQFPVLPEDYVRGGVLDHPCKRVDGFPDDKPDDVRMHMSAIGQFVFCPFWVNPSRLTVMAEEELLLQAQMRRHDLVSNDGIMTCAT